MKILVISNLFPPEYLGGYELSCMQMCAELTRQGHEVTVLTSTQGSHIGKNSAYLDPILLNIKRVFRLNEIYRYSTVINEEANVRARFYDTHNVCILSNEIETVKPDVVYLFNLFGLGGIGILECLKVYRQPWVWQLGDHIPDQLVALPALRPILPFDSGKSEGSVQMEGTFVLCSERLNLEILLGGVELTGEVHVCPNWIEIDDQHPERPKKENDGFLRMCSAGYLGEYKGIDLILEAAQELRASGYNDFLIDLYGIGESEKYLKMIRELKLGDHVRILGNRTQVELRTLFRNYHAFLFPTWSREPFGLAPLEAAAQGCVSLITDNCGVTEWMVDQVDCIKIERSSSSLVKWITKISQEPELLERISKTSFQRTREYFRIERIVPKIEDILRREASKKKKLDIISKQEKDRLINLSHLSEKVALKLTEKWFEMQKRDEGRVGV